MGGADVKVIVLGAGGIIGQTMRLYQPPEYEVLYYRRHADILHSGIDLTDWTATEIMLRFNKPDVVINLAGENRPDIVERTPGTAKVINVVTPERLARWCFENGAHYCHISSQAVFSGEEPPYQAASRLDPLNEYGRQKAEAEYRVTKHVTTTVLRPTFVLGLRPLPHVGRQNPLEQMLANPKCQQVDDRWFSPVFARELAQAIWVAMKHTGVLHIGRPNRVSRFDIAMAAGGAPQPASHDQFAGAQRPKDTSYSEASVYDESKSFHEALLEAMQPLNEDATDVSLFLGIPLKQAEARLSQGFIPLHNEVSADFRKANPQSDSELLDWYRKTEAYIWELTAYHRDEGFNYAGMIDGIAGRLVEGTQGQILCVGDGVGELTLKLREAGLDAVYHDLAGSRTAEFAQFRFWRKFGSIGELDMSNSWTPQFEEGRYEAIVCLDFLEHVTDVPAWIESLYSALKPGGVALFQNAFGLGSGKSGGIPMHLERNDRYVKEYTGLMQRTGWKQIDTSNWWQRPVAKEKAA